MSLFQEADKYPFVLYGKSSKGLSHSVGRVLDRRVDLVLDTLLLKAAFFQVSRQPWQTLDDEPPNPFRCKAGVLYYFNSVLLQDQLGLRFQVGVFCMAI